MKVNKNILNSLLLLAIVVVVNVLSGLFYHRFDLTEEKRYSLSKPTKTFLKEVEDIVSVKVYLTGKLPAGMQELENSTKDILNEFKAYAGNNFQYEFIDLTDYDKTTQEEIGKELFKLGLKPTNLSIIENGEQTQKVIFPGAVVSYKGANLAISLLENKVGLDQFQILNNSIILLEYKFANAIQKLKMRNKPTVAFLQGNGEASMEEVSEIVTTLQQENFAVAKLNLQESFRIDPLVNVVVVAKPTIPFSNKDKFKLDQFIMHGGKVLWLIDKMAVDMDSLQGDNFFFAPERDLNLTDMLFRYGVRVNGDLIQDLQNGKLEIQTGVVNNAPQTQLFDWPFYALVNTTNNHPTVNNLAPVFTRFASTIDTISSSNANKTILLETSSYSKALLSPVRVHLGMVNDAPNPGNYKQSFLPAAVALEGEFTSVFKNRITDSYLAIADTVEELKYRETSEPTKMIVIGDGDVIINETKRGKKLPLGYTMYGPQNAALVFDNKPFILNCIEYLIDDNNLIETRNKEIKLRQLDAPKVKAEKGKWKLINLFVPIILLSIFGAIFYFVRKRKYAS